MAQFIPRKPDEKDVISVQISSKALKEVDKYASSISISRNELINQMTLFALPATKLE